MGTNRLRSRRVAATSVVLWALLVTATSLELYDELPEVDSPSYQDENYLDTGSIDNGQGGSDLALEKMLLYRLIQSLQKNAKIKPKFKSDWPTEYQPPHRAVRASEDFSKEAMVKRLTNALTGSERTLGFRSPNQMYRLQKKWKIKKGKYLGNQMVCYFKLCAFRSPM